MTLINFCLGVMSVLIAYAMFSDNQLEEAEEAEVRINGVSSKLIELSCQTCRKLKNHREVEPGVFECVKCHRRIYTR
jgi:uncharacterized paraquat-inducible protein A